MTDKALANRRHRPAGALEIRRPANHGPTLRQGVDLTFGIGVGAKWLAIVEVSAAVPVAVPGMQFNVLLKLPALVKATVSKDDVIALPRQTGEFRQDMVKEKREPDAFAPSVFAHQV